MYGFLVNIQVDYSGIDVTNKNITFKEQSYYEEAYVFIAMIGLDFIYDHMYNVRDRILRNLKRALG